MAYAGHRSLVVFVFYKVYNSIFEPEVQELLVKVTFRPCLVGYQRRVRNKHPASYPYDPKRTVGPMAFSNHEARR